ncbi:hypothetical protein [Acidithiobacillus caldus]|nr:hypothetical protein [Acidithiobacillus caldus]
MSEPSYDASSITVLHGLEAVQNGDAGSVVGRFAHARVASG